MSRLRSRSTKVASIMMTSWSGLKPPNKSSNTERSLTTWTRGVGSIKWHHGRKMKSPDVQSFPLSRLYAVLIPKSKTDLTKRLTGERVVWRSSINLSSETAVPSTCRVKQPEWTWGAADDTLHKWTSASHIWSEGPRTHLHSCWSMPTSKPRRETPYEAATPWVFTLESQTSKGSSGLAVSLRWHRQSSSPTQVPRSRNCIEWTISLSGNRTFIASSATRLATFQSECHKRQSALAATSNGKGDT